MLSLEKIKWSLLGLSLCFLLLLIPSVQNLFYSPLSFENSKYLVSISVILCLTCILTPVILDKILFIKQNFTDKNEKIHFCSLAVFSIIILGYLSSRSFGGDDVVFQIFLDDKYLPQFLLERYYGCTTRVVIETFLVGIINAKHFFWVIFTTIAIVSIFESIASITLPKEKRIYSGLIYALFFLIPEIVISDAGWGATALNYIWPLAASMPTFLILNKLIKKEDISLFDYVYSVILLIFASNSELIALILGATYLLFIVYSLYQKKLNTASDAQIPVYSWIVLIICVGYIIFMLTSPGNANRTNFETINSFPEYSRLNLFDKIELGILSTFPFFFCSGSCYPLNYCIIILLFLFCLYFYETGNKKMILFQIPSLIFIFIFNYLPLVLFKVGVIPSKGLLLFSNIKIPEFSIFSSNLIAIEIFVFLILLASILYSIYNCFESKQKSIVIGIILLAGVCSRLTMGFSPTVYASGNRPFLFMIMAILVVCSFILSEILEVKKTISVKYLGSLIVIVLLFIVVGNAAAKFRFAFSVEMFYPKNDPVVTGLGNKIESKGNYNEQIPDLQVRKYNNTNLNCGLNIDNVNGNEGSPDREFSFNKTGLSILGWAIDMDNIRPFSDIYVKIGNNIIKADYGLDREDVKNAFKLQFANVGFSLTIPYDVLKNQNNLEFIMIGETKDFKYEPIIYELSEE